MNRLRGLLVRVIHWFVGRDPTDAEIIARSRHPERATIDLDDVGLGLFLRWGSFCGELCAMPPARDVGHLWREIAVETLQDNNMPFDSRTVDQTLEAWFMAGVLDAADEGVRNSFGLSFSRQKRTSKFAN
jgi:hypothetical protein